MRGFANGRLVKRWEGFLAPESNNRHTTSKMAMTHLRGAEHEPVTNRDARLQCRRSGRRESGDSEKEKRSVIRDDRILRLCRLVFKSRRPFICEQALSRLYPQAGVFTVHDREARHVGLAWTSRGPHSLFTASSGSETTPAWTGHSRTKCRPVTK
jgi:hypothetical protein